MSPTLDEKLRAFDGDLPLERARTIPSCWYTDVEIYAAERRRVFGRGWQALGRVDQLPGPGSFITADVAGEPILVLRDGDGVLRAFHNVCRHRAARVIPEAQGQATKLRCPYHGWTYDLTGRLRGTPEFDGVADFCREDNGLVPLGVETWGPLVFVHETLQGAMLSRPQDCKALNVDSGRAAKACHPIMSLAEFLSPLPKRIANLEIDTLRFVERRTYDLACNWKVFVDNYLDGGYHVNSVHPGLAGVIDYTHYRTEVFDHTSVQSSPLRADDTSPEKGTGPVILGVPSPFPDVGKVRTGTHAYFWWVFPNLMINIYQGVMDTNLVLPLGPERCRVVFDFYFAHTQGDDARRFMADSIAVAHQVQLEDAHISEDVQKGLASHSYDTGRFSVRREIAGYHFHRLLARRLRSVA